MFLMDENLPADLIKAAQDKGIEAQWVRNIMPGAKDSMILERKKMKRKFWSESDFL
jgi:predicted nuclease of predicted toxin-antitoxin system